MKRGNSHRGGLVQLGWMPQKSGGHQAPQKDSGRPLLSPRWEGTFTYGLPVSSFSRIVLGYSPVMQHSVPVYPPRDRGWGGEGEREWERERENMNTFEFLFYLTTSWLWGSCFCASALPRLARPSPNTHNVKTSGSREGMTQICSTRQTTRCACHQGSNKWKLTGT